MCADEHTINRHHAVCEKYQFCISQLLIVGLVEEGYHQNPYHNAIHAADVTQAMHCYILQEKVGFYCTIRLQPNLRWFSVYSHLTRTSGVNRTFTNLPGFSRRNLNY